MRTVKAEDVKKAIRTGDKVGQTTGRMVTGVGLIAGAGFGSALLGFFKGSIEIVKELMPPAEEEVTATETETAEVK